MSEATLTIPGVIFVGAEGASKDAAVVHLGPAVGWTIPRGVHTWSRELSVVIKQDLSPALLKELGVVLPEQQGDPEFVPRARDAAKACTVVAVEEPLAEQLVAKGVRVHTIGFDRVSNGFFYFANGGGEPRRIQGELIEIIAPSLDNGGGTREDLDARLDGLIDRLIGELSGGALSEAQIELAEALPPLAPKADKAAAKLQTLEGWLILASTRSTKFDAEARRLAEVLRGATRREGDVIQVPLFDKARRVVQPELSVEVIEGEAGQKSRLTLPARSRWFVAGDPTTQPAPKAAEDKAAADRAAAEAATRRAAEAAAQKAAAEKAAADRAMAERAAAEKAAEKAKADRAAADRAAAERAAAAAAERAAADRAAAAAAERAAAERAAAEKAAAERAAAERAAAAAAERAAAERAAAEKAAAEKAAAERAALERAAAERSAADKAAADKAREASAARAAALEGPKSSRPPVVKKKDSFSVVFIVVMLVVGAVIGALVRLARR